MRSIQLLHSNNNAYRPRYRPIIMQEECQAQYSADTVFSPTLVQRASGSLINILCYVVLGRAIFLGHMEVNSASRLWPPTTSYYLCKKHSVCKHSLRENSEEWIVVYGHLVFTTIRAKLLEMGTLISRRIFPLPASAGSRNLLPTILLWRVALIEFNHIFSLVLIYLIKLIKPDLIKGCLGILTSHQGYPYMKSTLFYFLFLQVHRLQLI